MIEELVTELVSATSLEVHADIVPVNASYPCIRFQRIIEMPWQTKDGADMAMTMFQCNVYANSSSGGESAYQIVYDHTEAIKTALNGLMVEDTEYRIEDIWDSYEEETELFYTQFYINVVHNIEDVNVQFSLTEAWTGSKFNGDKVYVQSFVIYLADIFSDGSYSNAYLTNLPTASVDKILNITQVYYNSQSANTRVGKAYTNLVFYAINANPETFITIYYTKV